MSDAAHRPVLMSMTRRVALTVLAAFAVVFVVLYVVLWHQALAVDTGELDRNLLEAAQRVARTLDRLDSEEAARTAVALFGIRPEPLEPDSEPPLWLKVARRDGSFAHDSGPLAALDVLGLAEGAGMVRLAGTEWRVYTARGQRWMAVVADDAPARSRHIGWQLLADLATYLAMALPIVLLPVWWLARATLKPLRQLSDAVAARAPLDTRPLPSVRRWRELAPLEEALNRLFERTAAGLVREKTFVHDAAHELRTPLAVIAAQAHVLAQAEGAERDAARERLHAAVTRASHLTQQLLLLARADTAARTEPQALCLMNLVRDAMALLAARAAAQGTELDLQGPDHAPMQSDPRALRSIIDNLLDNALRYGGPGGVVTVQVLRSAAQLELQVSDQGPGLAADEHERVFERFHRGSASHSEPGSGLGLAIVREAAHSLGGQAHWRPSARGALFVVALPLNTVNPPFVAS